MGPKTVFTTLTTDVSYKDVEGVGTLRWEADKCYRWVKNPTTNFTPAAGNLVCHKFTDGTTAMQNVYKPATAILGFLAGVVCGTFSASTGTNPNIYGWIQVFGQNALVNITPANTQTTNSPIAGASLKGVDAQVYAALDVAVGTAPIYTRRLLNLDVVTAGTTFTPAAGNNTFIQCL